jgi:uncharacterized protein (TIGR03000 family)
MRQHRLRVGVIIISCLLAFAARSAAQAVSRITMFVPADRTEVMVDKTHAAGEGNTRVFETPPLEPGRTYTFTITAKWDPNGYTKLTRTRTVSLRAGENVTLDLTKDEGDDRAEIRYVPTTFEVVETMIKVAGITPDDVVYEPGCGDARITIAAVKAGARRGVGIDISEERVAESKVNVLAAGLQDKIEIRMGDALDIKDLSNATVVFLYMGNEFNMLLRPILWKQLRVGTRVVSHRFTMGDWKPDKTVSVYDDQYDGYATEVHLWTITEEHKRRAESR